MPCKLRANTNVADQVFYAEFQLFLCVCVLPVHDAHNKSEKETKTKNRDIISVQAHIRAGRKHNNRLEQYTLNIDEVLQAQLSLK